MTSPHRTALNVVLVSSATVLQIILQFLFSRAIAGLYGAAADTDSLTAALVLPTVSAAIVTGSLSYVLVPDLVSRFQNAQTERSAWQLASYVGLVTFGIGAAVSLLLGLAAHPICSLLYRDMLPAQLETTVACLRILSIQVVLNGAISWAQAILHSRHQFLMAALGGVVGMSISLLIANQMGAQGIRVIAWAINVGAAVSLILHLIPLVPRLGWPSVEQSTLLKLLTALWPLLLGAAFLRLDPLVDRILASELDTGSITYIHFAQRIMAALLALGTSSLALIAFPQLAERFTAEGRAGLAGHLALAIRRLCLLVIPITIGVSVFSVEIVSDLLQRGKFTSDDSRIVGWLVIAMMGMFVGASVGELLARAFYVLGDTRTPTFVGVASLLSALVTKFILFKYFIGIWGIALGVSFYFLTSATVMAFILTRKLGPESYADVGKYSVQAAVAAVLACGCCYLIYSGILVPQSFSSTWLAGPVGGLVYVAGLLAMRNGDAWQLWQSIQHRFARRATQPPLKD